MDKVINHATSEIFETIKSTFNGSCGTGNFWINDKYNIVADAKVENIDKIEESKIVLRLEEYDENENLINNKVDCEISEDMSCENLHMTIQKLLNKNKVLLN